MSPSDASSTLSLNDGDADENRVRAALGLAPQARAGRPAEPARHRAGRETEVAVTVLHARRPEAPDGARLRLAALESELKAERAERVAAQQALADAQRVIQQLQTKLAHAEMASSEALGAERRAREAAQARLKEIEPARPPADAPAPAKRRGRPPGRKPEVEAPEPEPVQWWLPNYAAKVRRARAKS